jgi:SAM-dependent methyltransferase
MAPDLSPRLAAIVDALPLRPGVRVLEIGCGPGAAAREISSRVDDGHVLGIDRSAKAIAQATAGSGAEIASGRLSFRHVPIEDFELEPGEVPFDIALAVRVGALDGRHPELERDARARVAAALSPTGRLATAPDSSPTAPRRRGNSRVRSSSSKASASRTCVIESSGSSTLLNPANVDPPRDVGQWKRRCLLLDRVALGG